MKKLLFIHKELNRAEGLFGPVAPGGWAAVGGGGGGGRSDTFRTGYVL